MYVHLIDWREENKGTSWQRSFQTPPSTQYSLGGSFIVLRGLQILKFDLSVVLLAPDWLWPQSTTPSQDLRSQNRWLVQWWDRWGPTVSVKKCPTSCFVQIEAANSKWVITDSSSKLKIFNALSGICSPAYISVDGVRYLSIVVHWTRVLLRRKT